MDLKNGVKKRPGGTTKSRGGRSKTASKRSGALRGTTHGGKKAPKKIKVKQMTIPKTASARSRKPVSRLRMSRASNTMSLTDLQFLAKDRGIPFGGLSRTKLIKKINNYMY